MKKYFYSDGTDSHGPFTLDELKEKGITRDTDVWFEGLPEWTHAANVPELSVIFTSTVPPIHKTTSRKTENTYNQIPPKTWLVESILVTLFCCLPFGIVGIINSSRVESRFYSGDIEGAEKASREAKKWTMIGLWSALACVTLYFFIIIAVAFSGYSYW